MSTALAPSRLFRRAATTVVLVEAFLVGLAYVVLSNFATSMSKFDGGDGSKSPALFVGVVGVVGVLAVTSLSLWREWDQAEGHKQLVGKLAIAATGIVQLLVLVSLILN